MTDIPKINELTQDDINELYNISIENKNKYTEIKKSSNGLS